MLQQLQRGQRPPGRYTLLIAGIDSVMKQSVKHILMIKMLYHIE